MKALCDQLHLTTLAQQYPHVVEQARAHQSSYEACLTHALTVEVQGRQERAMTRRLRAARLPFPARLETFDFRFQPTLSEQSVRELASLTLLTTATNVIFLGPPGVGKTHLACSVAVRAVEAGHSALFVTLREVVRQVDAGIDPRTLLRRYSQPSLLVLDELGYTHLQPAHAQLLFEVISTRYERRPTIVTSNLTFSEWGSVLGDEILATALLDRLLHHAVILPINGRSYRMRERMQGDQTVRTETGGSKKTGGLGQK